MTSRTSSYLLIRVRQYTRIALLPVLLVLLWLASGLAVPDALRSLSATLGSTMTIMLAIVFEALPFLLLGVLLSAGIAQFVRPAQLQRLVPTNRFAAALLGGCLGLVLPVCECGTIPAARRLIRQGASPTFGLAFMLAAPVINPVVILSSAVAFASLFGWEFVALRVGLSLVVAMIAALLIAPTIRIQEPDLDLHHHQQHDGITTTWMQRLLSHATHELFELLRFLLIGAAVAACFQAFVPTSLLTSVTHPLFSIVAMQLLAALLSICSTVDAFVALAFVGQVPTTAILAFLVFGPMVDLKSMLLYRSLLPTRAIVRLVVVIAVLVTGCCSLIG
ncbi:MAG: permease [Roseiflexaceae bacterium]